MLKKLMSIFMAVLFLLSTGVQAFAGDSLETALNKVNLYVKENAGAQLLTWKGIIDARNFAPAVIVYRAEDGKEYPAYCANPNRPGVENCAEKTYDVDVDQLDTDPVVWGVITNGYPYKSPAELGVKTDYEAYYITKMAVWAVVHDNYSNLDDWKANGSQNAHVEKAMKNLVAKGRTNQHVYKSWLAITPKAQNIQEDTIDSNYMSQEYSLKSNVDIRSYRVVIDGDVPSGAKVTDLNNKEKDSFDGSETQFKVLIPKASMKDGGEFRVLVKGKLENKAVMFGVSHDPKKQDYYVAPLPSYNGDSWVQLAYGEGGTAPDEPTAKDGSLKILKVEKGTTEGLEGAVFKVEVNNRVIGHYVTDKNGEIVIPDISGVVSITEEVPPLGYVLDENNHKDVTVGDTKEPTVVTFSNEEMAKLEIKKVDADTGESLAGAVIRVALDDGSNSWDVYTNASGTATLTNMKSGSYTVTEIVPPEGYLLNKEPVMIKLEAGKTATVTLKDKAKPGIVIKKYDEDTGMPLENAEFSVAKKGGSIVYEGMTDKDGKIKVENLVEGWYTITELAPPKGYLIATESKDVYLEGGKCVEVKFDNRLRPSLQIMKIDAETGEPLVGAKFKVQKTEDKTVSEYVTDKTGTIVIHDLDEAVYTVEEIEAPDGYTIDPDNHKDIALEWGKTKTLVFSDTRKPALKILKMDARTEEPLANAKFKITKTEDDTVSEYMTDENGKITIQDLPEGIYTVEEISAPDGYILDTQHKEIQLSAGDSKQLVYENTRKPDLIITKTNAMTEKPVPNTTFKIEYEGANGGVIPLGTYKTDKNGQIVLRDVDPGWYIITEIRPAQGFQLPSNPVTRKYLAPGENAYGVNVGNNEDNSNSVTPPKQENDDSSTMKPPQNGDIIITSGDDYIGEEIPNYPLNSIVIKKTDANTSELLAGAVFEVRKVSEDISGNSGTIIGRYTTDKSGIIVITGLEAGAYIIEEVNPPANYLLSENSKQQAWLKADGTSVVEVAFANYPYGSLLITKVDALTNKPLSNATFQVTTGDGTVVGNSNGMYTTNSNGEILIPNLKPGSYVVTERIAPEGYACDTKPQTIEIGTDGGTYKVDFTNKPLSGIKIVKIDSETREPLEGVVFSISKLNGEKIGTFETDKEGMIYISNLEDGYYTVTETEGLEGYHWDKEPKTVEVKSGTLTILEVKNQPYSGLVIEKTSSKTDKPIEGVEFLITKLNGKQIGYYKTDSSGLIVIEGLEEGTYFVKETKAAKGYQLDNEAKEVKIKDGERTTLKVENDPLSSVLIHKVDAVTGKGIYGVKFLLYDGDNNPIGQYESDDEGYVYISKELPEGKYKLRELEPQNGYVRDDVPRTFHVKKGKTTEIEWENTPEMGQIQITKKSADDNPYNGFLAGTVLQGATFEIYDRANNLLDTIVSDKNGIAISKPLPIGRYLIRETKAPAFYAANANEIEAEIEFVGQIVRLEVLNSSLYTNVSVKKRGYAQVAPNQSIRYDFSGIKNNSTTQLSSFYWRDTLPVEAVRLDKIITGTWNQKLSYKIVYKTNMNGYRTLADNLDTAKNNVIAASPAALGLPSNEYVTEIMFVFGTVKSGFSQVETPYIYCNVLPNVYHEQRFTNHTDVGGLHQNQWIMSNDRWVTVVYGKKEAQKLPRTGY